MAWKDAVTELGRQKARMAVCLAAFNGIRWLPEQLDSILKQQDVALTVFVSVDESSDGTEAWVDFRAAQDERIVVLPHGESFGGAARNFFRLIREIDFSGFDYVCFADQDDIWFPEKLVRAHEVLVRTGADGYSSNVIAFWPNGRKMLVDKSQPQQRWDFLFEAAGPGCTYVMKVGLVQAIQTLFQHQWNNLQNVTFHDWFTYAFARANGYRWVIDEYASMLYRQHSSNQFGANSGRDAFKHRLHKVLDGWWLRQARLIAQIVGVDNLPLSKHGLDGESLLWLAMHARQCRRRTRDKFLFIISCLVLSVTRKAR